MTLTLRAVSLNEQPLSQPITAHFDSQGGTIGRSDHNTMALPDPERHISRQQAQIIAVGKAYSIKNVGSANPIMVRGQTLSQGEAATLQNRDQVRIGGYLLEVVEEHAAEATTITRGRATVESMSPSGVRANPTAPPLRTIGPGPTPAAGAFGDLGSPLSSGNPFADLIGSGAAPIGAAMPAPMAAPMPAAAPRMPRPSPNDPPPPSPRKPSPPRPSTDPFGDLPVPAGMSASSAAWAPPPPAPPAGMLPDDFDPFAPPKAAPPPPAGMPSRGAAGAFDDLIPSSAPASIDDLFGLQGGNARDPLADFLGSPPPPPKSPNSPQSPPPRGPSTDPFAMFGNSAEPPAPPAQADHTPELRGAFVPPAVRAERPVQAAPAVSVPDVPAGDDRIPTGIDWLAAPSKSVAAPARAEPPPSPPRNPPEPAPAPTFPGDDEPMTMMSHRPPAAPAPPVMPAPPAPRPVAPPLAAMPAPVPPTSPVSGDADALWHAFCEGAGVRLDLQQGPTPEMMRMIGSLLRASIDGTVKLVAVRAATKHELRAQVTMIQARNNNPLKFSPDAQVALEQMLQPPVRGFLSGPAAMTDVMNDLLGHSIGTMAGMRAALDGVLDRFAPNDLEAKLAGKSVLDSVLPMNRKAKLWELYLQHFEAIRNEAQDDFQALFGKAFVAAYEQQLERLRREKPSGGG